MKIWNAFTKQTDKWLYRILLVAFLVTMVPVLYLSRYAVPNFDDYIYGLDTHLAWEATHSVWAVLQAAFAYTAETWQKWQGTWFSIFFMTLMPGIWSEKLYFLTTFIMTFMVGGSITALVSVVLKKYVTASDKEMKYARGICVLVLLFLVFQTFVSPAIALYWYNGALHYVFMESVLFFWAAAALSFLKEENRKKRILYFVLAVFLGTALGGANLLTALQSVILHVFLLLFLFRKKNSHRFYVLGMTIANLIGFAMNVLAPGNLIREDTAESMGAVKAVIMSFYWGAVFITEWLTPLVLVGFVLLLPVIWKMVRRSETAFFHPAAAVLVSYCIFSAMFTPTLYAMSSEGPDRCKNVMRMVLYLLVFFNLVNGMGWAAKKGNESVVVRLMEEVLKAAPGWLLSALICLGAIFVLPADKNTYTSVSAVRSLVNGEAREFYEENEKRLELYLSDEKFIFIDSIVTKPYLLFTGDVTNEGREGHWVNIALMKYYGKDAIIVRYND